MPGELCCFLKIRKGGKIRRIMRLTPQLVEEIYCFGFGLRSEIRVVHIKNQAATPLLVEEVYCSGFGAEYGWYISRIMRLSPQKKLDFFPKRLEK
jgi:hypothetical protein